MRALLMTIMTPVIFVLLINWTHKAQAAPKPKNDQRFRQQMLNLSMSLSNIVPYAYSDSLGYWQKNSSSVKKELRNLRVYAHTVDSLKGYEEGDPAIKFVARKFVKDLVIAEKLVELNRHQSAKAMIKSITGYCIACHSQKSTKSYYEAPLFLPEKFYSFSNIEKAEFYAASRQFTDAIKHYEYVLVDKNFAKRNPDAWSLAMKRLLSIVVRNKQNAGLTLELISRIRESKSIPKDLSEASVIWRNYAKSWRDAKEPRKFVSREAKLEKAKALFQESIDIKAKHKNKPDFDLIPKLRASNLLHELLAANNKDKVFGESLYWAGRVSEELKEINFWSLHEVYYEACIRSQPKTPLAKMCYQNYERLYSELVNDKSVSKHTYHAKAYLQQLKELSGS